MENIVFIAGINALGEGLSSNGGAVFGLLKDWNEREETLDDILDMVENIVVDVISEAEIFVMGSNSLPGVESTGEVSMRLLDVQNHSDEELAELADKIELAASEREEWEEITKKFSVSKPYVDVRIDEDKAKFLGVNLDDVYSALRVNLSGDEVNDFTGFGHVYKVVLQADSSYRDSLVTLTKTTGASQISRYNCVRCVNFEGNVGEGFSTEQALDAMEEVVEEIAPNTFQIEWSRQSRQEKLAQNSVLFSLVARRLLHPAR